MGIAALLCALITVILKLVARDGRTPLSPEATEHLCWAYGCSALILGAGWLVAKILRQQLAKGLSGGSIVLGLNGIATIAFTLLAGKIESGPEIFWYIMAGVSQICLAVVLRIISGLGRTDPELVGGVVNAAGEATAGFSDSSSSTS